MKRYDIYTVLTFILLLAVVILAYYSWVFLLVIMALVTQYEVVHWNVSLILKQYKLYQSKVISELQFSKFQLKLKKLFLI